MLSLASSSVGFAAPRTGTNPFESKTFYVNPSYRTELASSISTAVDPAKTTMQSMTDVASAYWIDRKAKINGNTTDSLEGILADAASKSPVPLVTVILYDLPNRDCDAKASNGEICCYTNTDGTCDYTKAGDCADGLTDYRKNYVDPYAAVLKQYQDKVSIVVVVEPDSLPNLATNMGNPHCGNSATTTAYKTGIKYAIDTVAAQAPKVTLYLDAAHGGWLGWANNAAKFVTLVSDMDVATKIRGFSSNVANYQGLGTPCSAAAVAQQLPLYCKANATDPCCGDPCSLLGQWNSGNNEYNYVQLMSAAMSKGISGFSPHWIIDTGRNGVDDMRDDCANWCNARGAGVGLLPTTTNKLPALVDALFWLKTPGESDGCTETLPSGGKCARYDSMCGSADSIGSKADEPRCPEAGNWFDYQIKQLATNAHMGGGAPPSPAPGPSPVQPTPAPTPAQPTPAPTPAQPTPAPAPAGKCAKAFTQCGGVENSAHGSVPYDGPTCCPAGYECELQSQYYSQCMPTPDKVAASQHNGLFATAYEHAKATAAAKSLAAAQASAAAHI